MAIAPSNRFCMFFTAEPAIGTMYELLETDPLTQS